MNNKVIAFVFFIVILISCKKQPGEGGFATVEGKVFMYDYDPTFTILNSKYYPAGETVYIIYGTGTEIGNTVKTSYDGSFKFNYLRKGTYKIYVMGKDSTKPYLSIPKETLIEVVIKERKQKVVLEDLIIID